MKNRFLILILLVLTANVQAQGTFDEREHLLFFVFGDNVNLRAEPSLQSKIIANVDAGTALRFLNNVKKDTIGNKVSQWCHVWYNNQQAYVWKPLITRFVQRSGKNPDYYFLAGEGDSTWHTKIKVVYQGKVTQSLSFTGIKPTSAIDEYAIKGSQGVPLVDDLLYIHWSAYSCGQMGGYIIFAFDGHKLHHFGEDTGIGDGEFFEGQTLITPSHIEGEKGVVIIRRVSGEMLFPEEGEENQLQQVRYDYNTTTRYRWNGTKLVKI
ncbi:MAG: SH3 domain-containing protein [Bacteroidota bacterium]